ncbi:MAG: hypothetical protein QXZ38_03620 [Candidatus Micrarchaeaceae archaeon]
MTNKELKEAGWTILAGFIFIVVYVIALPQLKNNPYGWIILGIGVVLLVVGIIALLRKNHK